MTPVPLYTLPRGSWFRPEDEDFGDTHYLLGHVDGMYSLCYQRGDKNKVVHWLATLPVIPLGTPLTEE